MKIFLIAGKAGSGKAEVAKMIKEFYIYKKENSIITGYSKYLKMYAKEMIDWDGNENNKPRKFLQDLGSYIRHTLNMPYFFIDRMMDDIRVYEKDANICIIEDIRLPEEIEEIKKYFDDVTSILVINQFGKSSLSIEEQIHPTETALESYNGFDYTLVNSDLPALKEEIFKILEEK
ncbi:MAG: hypothetical protein IJO33_02180 [Bacilli bacterium]|nr:hypothetical protein [Bacilli bacterium]MBQ9833981.1 hypothetical protein [Bacilli bacterium]